MFRAGGLAATHPGLSVRLRRAALNDARGYAFLLPALAILLAFHFLPVFYAFYVSLWRWAILPERFVGLANYVSLLQNPEFAASLATTVWYVLGVVPLVLVLSLAVALLLYRELWGRSFYRVLYFLPYVTSTVAAAMVWRWIFQPRFGVANQILGVVGLPPQNWIDEPRGAVQLILQGLGLPAPAWAAGPSLALICIIVVSVWHAMGFDIVIFLAGLTNIPREIYDAARIDGAGAWSLFWHVTLPLLSPTIFFLVIVSTIMSFQAFNWFYIMSAGLPAQGTRVITIYLYQNAFQYFKMGYAAAVGFVLFGFIFSLTLLQVYVMRRRVFYGE